MSRCAARERGGGGVEIGQRGIGAAVGKPGDRVECRLGQAGLGEGDVGLRVRVVRRLQRVIWRPWHQRGRGSGASEEG